MHGHLVPISPHVIIPRTSLVKSSKTEVNSPGRPTMTASIDANASATGLAALTLQHLSPAVLPRTFN